MQDTLPDEHLLLQLKKENATLKAQVRSLFYLVAIYKELVALSSLKSNQVLAVREVWSGYCVIATKAGRLI